MSDSEWIFAWVISDAPVMQLQVRENDRIFKFSSSLEIF